MGLPQYSNIENTIQSTIKSRIGQNLKVSQLSPWLRISSAVAGGLVIESNISSDSFSTRYGSATSAGAIGRKFDGSLVVEDSSDRGFRPSPVIEGLSVKNGAQGLTRKCSFVIKCFSVGQMEKVSQYFLEPRYFALIEWGWNTPQSYNSMAKLKEDAVCEMIDYQNLQTLKNKRAASEGHYDAFLGIVAGGGFEYGEDETYNLNIEIVTQGEIPSYLQFHKGVVIRDEGGKIASSKEFIPTQIEDAIDSKNIGLALFMQMYNDLPGGKQITRVKNLGADPRWADPSLYINMDEEVRKHLTEKIGTGKIKLVQGKSVPGAPGSSVVTSAYGEIPSEGQLVSTERFIRMDLAWKILNTTSLDVQVLQTSCKGEETMNYVINIDNTICTAHPHIFSTDKSKLYIPNKNLPNFGLASIFFPPTSTDDIKKEEDVANSGQNSVYNSFDGVKEISEVDGFPIRNPNRKIEDWEYFPAQMALAEQDQGQFDGTYYARKADKGFWGYLKSLYINFDFFCECLEKNGYLAKDVALDILNGLSSAVNMTWDFQIAERGRVLVSHDYVAPKSQNVTAENQNKQPLKSGDILYTDKVDEMNKSSETNKSSVKGPIELQVCDFNFAGIPPAKGVPLMKFQSRGMNSPFTEFSFNVSVQGALANQVMAKRNAEVNGEYNNATTAPEDKGESFKGLFAKTPDPIMQELDSLNAQVPSSEEDELEYKSEKEQSQQAAAAVAKTGGVLGLGTAAFLWAKSLFESDTQEEVHVSNYEYFISKAGVFPKEQDREKISNGGFFDSVGLLEFLIAGTFADTNLLTQMREFDFCKDNKFETQSENEKKNPGLLPISMNFTIHGVSGLKVGDIFCVIDLPSPYNTKIFQIFHVEHTVSDGMWSTQIEAKLRNADIVDKDELKKLTTNG
jgi:hypothetical protein